MGLPQTARGQRPWSRASLATAAAVSGIVVLLSLSPFANPASGAPTSEGPFFSSEVYTTSTSCSNTAALRSAADLLDDEWRAVAQADSYEVATLPGPVDPALNPTAFTIGAVTAEISKHDVDDATALSNAPGSWGTVDVANTNDPETAGAATLQDCAPMPASLYSSSSSARTPQWRASGGDGSTLDAVMIEFPAPVAAFGAWVGDLETRQDAGVPARLKLFDAAGNVIANDPIAPDRPTPLSSDPSGRIECGGTQAADALACGNQATRFIGFAYDQPTVAAMLLIVGDDDSCLEYPTACSGHTEHLSLIGAQIAEYDTGALTVNKVAVGGSPADPWRFEVSGTNGCPLPETPYRREIPATGGSVTFADLAVTVDGQAPCTYTLTEQPTPGWTLDTANSDPMTNLTMQPGQAAIVDVVNRPDPTTTTTTSTSSTTSTSTSSSSSTSASSSTSSTSTTSLTTPLATETSATAPPTTAGSGASADGAGSGVGSSKPASTGTSLPNTGAESQVIAALGAALLAAGALLRASIDRRKLAGLSTWRARIRPTTSSNR